MPKQPLFRPEDFPNQLGLLHLTSKEIERQIESYSLSFPQTRNEEVENCIQFPQFIRAFYNFIYLNGKVPTQQEFYDYYLSINRKPPVSHVIES